MKRLSLALLIPVLVAAGLGGCATAADPYGRPPGGVAETRIAENRYRVSFQGRGEPGYAFDQALLRAAHLALRDDREWFLIEDRYGEVERGYDRGPTISIGGSNASFGRRSASSFGVGVGFQLGGGGGPRTGATLMIRTGSGPAPEGAFNARDVVATVGPRL